MDTEGQTAHHEPWNKGKIVGQKAPFKVKDIWALRVRLQMEGRVRELALFNLGIDSKPVAVCANATRSSNCCRICRRPSWRTATKSCTSSSVTPCMAKASGTSMFIFWPRSR